MLWLGKDYEFLEMSLKTNAKEAMEEKMLWLGKNSWKCVRKIKLCKKNAKRNALTK